MLGLHSHSLQVRAPGFVLVVEQDDVQHLRYARQAAAVGFGQAQGQTPDLGAAEMENKSLCVGLRIPSAQDASLDQE